VLSNRFAVKPDTASRTANKAAALPFPFFPPSLRKTAGKIRIAL
jgi:hypothetical protein